MGRKKKTTTTEETAEVTLIATADKIEKVLPPEEPGGEPTLMQVHPPVATEEPTPDAEPKKPKKGKNKPPLPSSATLEDLSATWLAALKTSGYSIGTVASYGMELKLAQDELGAETSLADLTAERVERFFNCKRVTKLRSGKNKSKLSVDKTRRVLRRALEWAASRGVIAKAPIPETPEAK